VHANLARRSAVCLTILKEDLQDPHRTQLLIRVLSIKKPHRIRDQFRFTELHQSYSQKVLVRFIIKINQVHSMLVNNHLRNWALNNRGIQSSQLRQFLNLRHSHNTLLKVLKCKMKKIQIQSITQSRKISRIRLISFRLENSSLQRVNKSTLNYPK